MQNATHSYSTQTSSLLSILYTVYIYCSTAQDIEWLTPQSNSKAIPPLLFE